MGRSVKDLDWSDRSDPGSRRSRSKTGPTDFRPLGSSQKTHNKRRRSQCQDLILSSCRLTGAFPPVPFWRRPGRPAPSSLDAQRELAGAPTRRGLRLRLIAAGGGRRVLEHLRRHAQPHGARSAREEAPRRSSLRGGVRLGG